MPHAHTQKNKLDHWNSGFNMISKYKHLEIFLHENSIDNDFSYSLIVMEHYMIICAINKLRSIYTKTPIQSFSLRNAWCISRNKDENKL